MHFTFALFAAVVTLVQGQDRKIIPKLNPGCSDCTDKMVVYTRAIGPKDTVHQLWDFTGVPTVLHAVGSVNSTINIEWWKHKPTTFTFNERPNYTFAIAIDRLYEYNDLKDKGEYDPSTEQQITPLSDLKWSLVNSSLTDNEAMLIMHGKFSRHREHQRGFIDVKLDLLPFTAEGSDLPHLIHTANSTLIDIRLVNLTTTRHFNSSRFALRFVLISNDNKTDSWNYSFRKSLDDEHTPGVFEIIEIYSPKESKTSDGGFLEFYPVAYTDPERGVSSSTNAHVSSINSSTIPNEGILKQFYQDYNDPKLLVQEMIVSFGLSGDGFYGQHNFTAWSLTFGYGTPPVERLSISVLIIIVSICGIIAALTLVAVGFISYKLIRRCRRNGHNYSQCQ